LLDTNNTKTWVVQPGPIHLAGTVTEPLFITRSVCLFFFLFIFKRSTLYQSKTFTCVGTSRITGLTRQRVVVVGAPTHPDRLPSPSFFLLDPLSPRLLNASPTPPPFNQPLFVTSLRFFTIAKTSDQVCSCS